MNTLVNFRTLFNGEGGYQQSELFSIHGKNISFICFNERFQNLDSALAKLYETGVASISLADWENFAHNYFIELRSQEGTDFQCPMRSVYLLGSLRIQGNYYFAPRVDIYSLYDNKEKCYSTKIYIRDTYLTGFCGDSIFAVSIIC